LSATSLPVDCAKRAFQVAQARLAGDHARADLLQEAFDKGKCDPKWGKCITEFLKNAAVSGQSAIPYRPWKSLSDFVITDALPSKATIGIAGDWGTGGPRAADVLKQIAAHNPDVFLHLGDIYYSCTAAETKSCFLDVCDEILPEKTRRFTLAGNHDMYAGGGPYYELLDQIGQPASFFALRNADWQLLGMDTGYNDFSPLNVSSVVTSLREGNDDGEGYDEVRWHLDKIENAGGRRTILASHHPLFSATGIAGAPINHKLLGQIGSALHEVELWLWGHEHSHIVFEPFAGLDRGRCIGASAVPVPSDDPDEDPYRSTVPGAPPIDNKWRLGVNKKAPVYNLGYAILRLDGKAAVLDHYDSETPGKPFFSETL
jgi:hypothetical protein